MNLLAQKVFHKLKGTGVVISHNDENVEVQFPSGVLKLQYPQAFERYYQFENTDIQKIVNSLIPAAKRLEAERKEQDKKSAEVQKINVERKIDSAKKIAQKAYARENIAFKCNYCDGGASSLQIGYAGVCSKRIIEFNILDAKRTWCSSAQCECNRFLNGELTYKDLLEIYNNEYFVCYESSMLVNWKASAGTDVKDGKMDRPRKLKKVQRNSLCILTTVYPDTDESERIIFGVFLVDETYEGDNQEEGYVTTASKYKLKLTPDEGAKILFWNYHKNSKDKGTPRWSSGLYRYLNDITSAQILRDIADVKKNSTDAALAKEFFEYYCKANNIAIDALPENNGALLI